MEYKPKLQLQDNKLVIKHIADHVTVDVSMENESYDFIVEIIHRLLGKEVFVYEVTDINLNFTEHSSTMSLSNPTVTFVGNIARQDQCLERPLQQVKIRVVTSAEVGIRFCNLIRNNEFLLVGPGEKAFVTTEQFSNHIQNLNSFSWVIDYLS